MKTVSLTPEELEVLSKTVHAATTLLAPHLETMFGQGIVSRLHVLEQKLLVMNKLSAPA